MITGNAMLLCFASGVPYGFRDRQRFELVPKIQEQKCEKLSAVIRSKLFLHEYENNTHDEAEQALPAWRGAGRSSRGTRPLLSSSGGARSFRIRLRYLLLYC